MQDATGQWTAGFSSRLFWPELAFLLAMLAIIVFAARRKKNLRLVLVLAGCFLAIFCLGVAIFS
jgi:lipopolysaccharide export LptBFGC system permease protein LptF